MITFENYNDFIEKIKSMSNEFREIVDIYNKQSATTYNIMYLRKLDAGEYRISNYNYVGKNYDTIKIKVQSINLFSVGRILGKFDELVGNDSIRVTKKLCEDILVILSDTFDSIYNFLNAQSGEESLLVMQNMIGIMSNAVYAIDKFLYTYTVIKEIESELESHVPENDNISTISIHFLKEEIDFESISFIIKSIQDIYDNMCNISNISTREFKLTPVKIETGSFFEKVFGNATIMKILEKIFTKAFTCIYREFSISGKTDTEKIRISLLREELKIVEECKNAGLNVIESSEELEKQLALITKRITELVMQTPKVKINGNIISIEKEYEKKLLEGNMKYLNGYEDENNQ